MNNKEKLGNAPYSIEEFESLYNKYKKDVFAIALAIIKDTELSKDIIQDVFVKLFLELKSKEITNMKSWLISVSRNTALDIYRKRTHEVYALDENIFDSIQFVTNDLTDRIVIVNCLKILDDTERQIVILKAVSGLKHREISRMVGIPIGTVLWKYRTALVKLKKNIEAYKQN